VEIKDFEADKNGWWALVVEESRSGLLYEDRVDYMKVKDVFAICQELVTGGEEDSNWLLDFASNHPDVVPPDVAKHIAVDLLRVPVDKAFPGVEFTGIPKKGKATTQAPKKASPKKHPAKAGKSGKGGGNNIPAKMPTSVVGRSCTENHDDLSSYTAVHDAYYFQSTRKYSSASCKECKHPFATDGNKKITGPKCPLPTGKAPVYIWNQLELDKTTCGKLICHECYLVSVKSNPTPTGRKRSCPLSGSGSSK
jgi:hypothetical protein